MRPFHNTPSLKRITPETLPSLTCNTILNRLEDDYANYRDDVNKGYCDNDPTIVEHFKARITQARDACKVNEGITAHERHHRTPTFRSLA